MKGKHDSKDGYDREREERNCNSTLFSYSDCRKSSKI